MVGLNPRCPHFDGIPPLLLRLPVYKHTGLQGRGSSDSLLVEVPLSTPNAAKSGGWWPWPFGVGDILLPSAIITIP